MYLGHSVEMLLDIYRQIEAEDLADANERMRALDHAESLPAKIILLKGNGHTVGTPKN